MPQWRLGFTPFRSNNCAYQDALINTLLEIKDELWEIFNNLSRVLIVTPVACSPILEILIVELFLGGTTGKDWGNNTSLY